MGNLIYLNLGGPARMVLKKTVTPQVLRDGMRADFGEGEMHQSGPRVLLRLLRHFYPTN